MAVRWRSRRTAPAPADEGRWGVARLVAEREAARLASARAGRVPVADSDPAAESDPGGGRAPAAESEPAAESDPVAESDPAGGRGPAADSDPAGDRGPVAGTGCEEHPDPRVRRDAAPAAPRTEDGEPVPHPGRVSLEVPRGTGVPGPRTPDPGRPTLPAPRRAPAEPSRGLPSPRGPIGGTEPQALIYRPPAVPARPPVELEPGLIGFSRLTRGRHGARAFTLAFVAIYLVIVVQTLSTIF